MIRLIFIYFIIKDIDNYKLTILFFILQLILKQNNNPY